MQLSAAAAPAYGRAGSRRRCRLPSRRVASACREQPPPPRSRRRRRPQTPQRPSAARAPASVGPARRHARSVAAHARARRQGGARRACRGERLERAARAVCQRANAERLVHSAQTKGFTVERHAQADAKGCIACAVAGLTTRRCRAALTRLAARAASGDARTAMTVTRRGRDFAPQ